MVAVAKIEWAVVPGNRRLSVLPKYFPLALMMRAEGAVYDAMGALCKAYGGGYWEYVEASNGAFFMYPKSETAFVLASPNGRTLALSPEAAGMTATLFALGRLASSPPNEKMSDLYHLLRDVAKVHEEGEHVLALIN